MDDHILFRAITEQATDAEQRTVAEWRRSQRSHEARYQELQAMLAMMSRAPGVATSPPAALEVLQQAAHREQARGRRVRVRRAAVAVAGLAAMLVVGVALDRAGLLRRSPDFGFEEMVTGDNQTVTVSLRDGSLMRLAPRSRARIRVREGHREVHLTGHAFFSVAKRNGLPFRVRTQAGDVTVLGTQFDVDARNDDLRLVVVQGRVSVEGSAGGSTRVGRGEAVRVVAGRLQQTEVVAKAADATKWVGRFLVFESTPLRQVADELARTYGAQVVIADSSLREQTITNWFSDRSLDDVTRVICAIVATECTVQGKVVTIGSSRQ